jgi:tripartite-type tricarboxylate transporter receptor subunit TctC
VPVIFVDLFTLQPFAKAGTLRVIAVTGSSRAQMAPDIPTAIEQGVKDFEVTAWLGLFAPAGTPDEIVNTLQRQVAAVASKPDFVKRMADSGAEVVASTPQQFGEFYRREVALYKRVANAANIRLE